MQETEVKKKLKNQVETGQWVSIMTTAYGAVSGRLIQQGEYIDEELGKQKCYRILLSEERYIDITEKEITYIRELPVLSVHDYYKRLEERYGITCYNENGEFVGETELLKEVLLSGIWDKFSDDDKSDFIKVFSPSDELIMDIVNAYSMSREENNKLQKKIGELVDEKIKLCEGSIKFLEQYEVLVSQMPKQYKWAFDFLYKYFGIDELLKAV